MAHLPEAVSDLRFEVPIGSRSAPVNAKIFFNIDDVLLFVLRIEIGPAIGHSVHPWARSSIDLCLLGFANLVVLHFVKLWTSSARLRLGCLDAPLRHEERFLYLRVLHDPVFSWRSRRRFAIKVVLKPL